MAQVDSEKLSWKPRKPVKDKTATLPKAMTFEPPSTDARRAMAAQRTAEIENERFYAQMDAYSQIQPHKPVSRPMITTPPYVGEILVAFVGVVVLLLVYAYFAV